MSAPTQHVPRAGGAARLAFWTLLGVGLLLAACAGPQGDDGDLVVTFDYTDDVETMDLSGMGLSHSSGLPTRGLDYALEQGSKTVVWTSNHSGESTRYVASFSVDAADGDAGENGLFPYNESVQVPPVTAEKGDEGPTRRYRIVFRENLVYVFKDAVTAQGSTL